MKLKKNFLTTGIALLVTLLFHFLLAGRNFARQ